LTIKIREFQLNEQNLFKNEIIHFFNIDAFTSIINIYLEIDGKRIKAEKSKKNFHKLILNELEANNQKKEINCIIVEDVELKILIKIISKYKRFFRKKSNSVQYINEIKGRNNKGRKISQIPIEGVDLRMSIKDRIKIFSGEFIKRQLENRIIPGRLKIPEVFLQRENADKSIKEEDEKDKDKDKKMNN